MVKALHLYIEDEEVNLIVLQCEQLFQKQEILCNLCADADKRILKSGAQDSSYCRHENHIQAYTRKGEKGTENQSTLVELFSMQFQKICSSSLLLQCNN